MEPQVKSGEGHHPGVVRAHLTLPVGRSPQVAAQTRGDGCPCCAPHYLVDRLYLSGFNSSAISLDFGRGFETSSAACRGMRLVNGSKTSTMGKRVCEEPDVDIIG